MQGDDHPHDEFRQQMINKMAELSATLGRHETEIGKCWNELHGLRETLEKRTTPNHEHRGH